MSDASEPGKIITFYSYKGGTGRSMAVANIAWILASCGKRVLVLDWDLEAPGLQRYFRPFLVDKDLISSEGIVDFFTDFILEAITPVGEGEVVSPDWYLSQADILRYVLSLNWKFPSGGRIDFVPAGRQGPDYASRFASINFQHFYDRLGGGALLEAAKEQMRANYDYVLIDSRTGVSDTAGISTVQMPDMLVVCFTFNNQSIEGAASVTYSAYEQHRQGNFRSALPFQVIPVPTRVDQSEKDKLTLRKIFARWRFGNFIESYVPAGERKAFWNSVEVPYLAFFSYEEILAPFKEDATDPKTCLSAFVRIANHIAAPERLEYISLISPEQQAAILQEFASIPVPITASVSTEEGQLTVSAESPIEKQLRLAESTFVSLKDDERAAARRLWTRLVRVPRYGEGVEITKVRVWLRNLDGAQLPLVEKFRAAELLVQGKDEKTKQETVEAASDELVRSWKRLQEWVKIDHDFLIWRQQLQVSIALWEASRREASELLHGRWLTLAELRYKERREDLNADEAAYVKLSLDYNQKRQTFYRRAGLAAVTAVLLLGILFLAVAKYYIKHRDTSNAAEKIAEEAAHQLNDSPQATLKQQADQLQLGLLLAVEAERLSPSPGTEALLKKYLPLLPRRVSVNPESDNVLRVALTGDGKSFVAITGRPSSVTSGPSREDRAVQLQDAATGHVIARASFKPGSRIYDLSPDGRYLAVGSGVIPGLSGGGAPKYSVSVMDIAKNYEVKKLEQGGAVRALAFSSNGRYLAASGDGDVTSVLDLSGGTSLSVRLNGAGVSVAFSPDNKFCAAASDASEVQVWPLSERGLQPMPRSSVPRNLAKRNFISAGTGREGDAGTTAPRNIKLDMAALNLAVSSGGRYVAAVSYSEADTFTVWDVQSGQQIGKRLSHSDNGDNIEALAFSPDANFLVTAGDRGTIRVWYVSQDGVNPFKSLRFDGDVYRLVFSSGGNYLAAVGGGSVARIWAVGDISNESPDKHKDDLFKEADFLILDGDINDLAFSADGNFVATAGGDNSVRVWYVNRPLGNDVSQDEPCTRLTRNMTIDEWDKFMPDGQPYRRTCQDIQKSVK